MGYQAPTDEISIMQMEEGKTFVLWMQQVMRNTSGSFSYTPRQAELLYQAFLNRIDPWEASSALQEGRVIPPEYTWRDGKPWWAE